MWILGRDGKFAVNFAKEVSAETLINENVTKVNGLGCIILK
jgi:hypothetical protein